MTQTTQQRWCHACGRPEDFDSNWFELWVGSEGECVIQPVSDPTDYHKQFRGDTFACGQLSALVLVERYLHTGTFNPPAQAAPAPIASLEPLN
jgi:hypothetical protein